MDVLDETAQFVGEGLGVAGSAGYVQRVVSLREAQHLPAVEQVVYGIARVGVVKGVYKLQGTIADAEQVGTSLMQVGQAIGFTCLSVALLYGMVNERTDGCVDLGFGVAFGDELVKLVLYTEKHDGLLFAHEVGEHLCVGRCLWKVLHVDVVCALLGIVLLGDKGVGCLW